jgi:hypothetical protein
MKKIKVLLILLISCVIVSAQGTIIKPAIGMNFMDFSKDPSTGKIEGQVGWEVGSSVMFGKKKWFFEPGIFFVHRSSQYSDNTTSANDIDFDIQGIRIPLGIGVNIFQGKSTFNVRALGGASMFLLTSIKDLQIDDFNKAQWALYAGAGLDISLFFLDFKYEWSLTNLQKNINDIDVGKTRSLFLDAGIRIKL